MSQNTERMFRGSSSLSRGCAASSAQVISFFGVFDSRWQQARRGEEPGSARAQGNKRRNSQKQPQARLEGAHQKQTPLGALAFRKVGRLRAAAMPRRDPQGPEKDVRLAEWSTTFFLTPVESPAPAQEGNRRPGALEGSRGFRSPGQQV
ncbi:hypothetical protein P7K49_032498 [Saguinus oedipus]|uniref:Uncharacterized protein n=1 Tax=Saguinus oedipus TaxID=9490 RepID=A0ABQ9TYE7_SAGOE|nr:hypothetical protein P7K49_032498 [Saguinus oedipus]